jgi:regulation of enolase protein 1 (concanavalin A-like superfamily)
MFSSQDIWDSADEFHYVYQPVSGDVTVIARVASIQNTNPWAKAGVMIRESLAAGSKNAMMELTPGNGVSFQRRLATNGPSTSVHGAMVSAPYWVKLVRSGNVLSGSASSDGVNWTVVGTDTVSMTASVYVGLAVTSHSDGVLATASLTNVSVTTGGGGGGVVMFDSTGTARIIGSMSPITFSVATIAPDYVVVGVTYDTSTQVTSVTWNGAHLSRLGGPIQRPGLIQWCELWGMAAPDSGTHNIIVTHTKTGKIDNATIIKTLHKGTWPTLVGGLSWDAYGAPKGDPMLVEWINGKLYAVAPKSLAVAKPVYPKASWGSG